MTRTVVQSKKKTVVIGFDQPFCVIGERINPTGRKILAAELEAGDFSTVEKDALEQAACGASMLDVNAGVVYNSNPKRLERLLPLVKKYNVPVVAISNDDTGISEDPDVRFAVAKKIVERAADHGIPAHDIVVDPLVMPIGAMATAGLQVFRLVRKLREELGVNTTCGASNISFGLPNRHGINAAFLPMAIASGMTSAIMNPVRPQEMEAIRAANLLTNNDPHGAAWIRANKAPLAEGEVEAGARGRREGRRRRA